MEANFKHTFVGYFLFYYKILGIKFIYDIILSVSVSFLDGFGLAMLIPLLSSMDSQSSSGSSGQSDSKLQFFSEVFNFFHVPLNIYSLLIGLGILFSLKGWVKFGQLVSQVNLKQKFIKKVRYELTTDLQRLSYEGFLSLDAGKVHNVLTGEVGKLWVSINQYLLSISGVAMLITYVVMAFVANWQFAILVIIGSTLSNILFRKIFNSVKLASVDISKKTNIFNTYLIEAVHYFKYLKATNNFKSFTNKIKLVIDDTENLNRRIGYYQSITSAVREPLIMVIVILVIIMQIRWLNGTLGSIMVSLLLFYRGLSFLMTFQVSWQGFVQTVGSIVSVAGLTEEMKDKKEEQNTKAFSSFSSGIKIEDLSFKYGDNLVIDKLNINIPKNTTIALVGESGSGKTTLANIITGLLKPTSGLISFDGISLQDYNLDSYRSLIGYISQEAVIFNDDIYNNITFWAEPTKENVDRFWEVIRMSSLENFIEALPDKERTKLGDNGMLISGGQKQRISIARELYKKAEILILDEATSALDSETELFIQDNIDKLHGSYTMIIIAHRLSTIKNVDQIYMLDKGVVSVSGSFDEMFINSPRFKRMVELQKL